MHETKRLSGDDVYWCLLTWQLTTGGHVYLRGISTTKKHADYIEWELKQAPETTRVYHEEREINHYFGESINASESDAPKRKAILDRQRAAKGIAE